MSIAFIACVESGRLEPQACLLFRSIRTFAGRLARARIVAYRPRAGAPLAAATLAVFRELEVDLIEERLNVAFEHYPIANKVLASAHAEEHLAEDLVVFLDSDTLITGEPLDLLLAPGIGAAVRPVNRKNRGSSGPDDKNDGYWQELYRIVGVKPGRFCTTTVEGERIREYWNAGLIVARRSDAVMQRWRDDFLRLMAREHIPRNGLNNMDQFALAASLTRLGERLLVLDERYNYPLPMRAALREPWRGAALEDLRHVHYFRWFQQPGFLAGLAPPIARDGAVMRFLTPHLPLPPIDPDPGRGRNRAAASDPD